MEFDNGVGKVEFCAYRLWTLGNETEADEFVYSNDCLLRKIQTHDVR